MSQEALFVLGKPIGREGIQKWLTFLSVAGRLKATARTGWRVRGLPDESVADHSFGTALITSFICDALRDGINCERAVQMALLHDIGEAYMGDWDLEATQALGRSKKLAVEESFVRNIFSLLPQKSARKYGSLWQEYSDGKTLESKIVHFSDKLEALIRARELSATLGSRSTFVQFKKNFAELTLDPLLERIRTGVLEVLDT